MPASSFASERSRRSLALSVAARARVFGQRGQCRVSRELGWSKRTRLRPRPATALTDYQESI
eukprot:357281-Chlamydomonas_euryale.AAC.9